MLDRPGTGGPRALGPRTATWNDRSTDVSLATPLDGADGDANGPPDARTDGGDDANGPPDARPDRGGGRG